MQFYPLTIKIWIPIVFILTSCSGPSKEENNRTNDAQDTISQFDPIIAAALSAEQKDAFDALDVLQGNTGGHLYSTFINTRKASLTPDTSFTLSQREFKETLFTITREFGAKSSQNKYEILVTQSALASNSYSVEFFAYEGILPPPISSLHGQPTNGQWIVRNIERQRDLILDWVAPSGFN